MRFMILVKGTPISEAGVLSNDDTVMQEIGTFYDELAKAGVLLDANALQPSSQGWRVQYSKSGERSVVDGPFAETKELLAGYTLIQVRSREEAMEWARRFPAPLGKGFECEIEVRPLYEPEDFEPSSALSST